MTCAEDVAYGIEQIVLNQNAFGEVIQIASSETLTWVDVAKLYFDKLEEILKFWPRVFAYDYDDYVDGLLDGGYQSKYGCEWNRTFSSQKADMIFGKKIQYQSVFSVLPSKLFEFIENGSHFLSINEELENHFDEMMLSGKLKEIGI